MKASEICPLFVRKPKESKCEFVSKLSAMAFCMGAIIFALAFFGYEMSRFGKCVARRENGQCADSTFYFACCLCVIAVIMWCAMTRCFCNCFCNGCCFQIREAIFRKTLRQLHESPHVTELNLSSSNPVVEHLRRLVISTWKDTNHFGNDARNLDEIQHNAINILHVFQIDNKRLVNKYVASHQQLHRHYELPRQLRDEPIKTVSVRLQPAMPERAASKLSLAINKAINNNDLNVLDEIGEDNMAGPSSSTRDGGGQLRRTINKSPSNVRRITVQQTSADQSAVGIVREPVLLRASRESSLTGLEPEPRSPRRQFGSDETSAASDDILQLKLGITDQGEAYLFHGTRLKNTVSIIDNGFDLDQSKHGMFGRGIYLAESSQKADQYTDDPLNRRSEFLTMFVVRTSLGKVGVYKRPAADTSRQTSTNQPVNTVLPPPRFDNGTHTIVAGEHKRFREFLKADSTHCYPEFLVIYNRVSLDLVEDV